MFTPFADATPHRVADTALQALAAAHSLGHAAMSSNQNDHACLLVVCSAAPVRAVSGWHNPAP